MTQRGSLPIIDIAPLSGDGAAAAAVGAEIDRACRESGFFYVVGHGVDPDALRRLDRLSRAFFALDLEEKMRIRMALGGRAWRGYFPVGAELTSGKPDQKEGPLLRRRARRHPPRGAGVHAAPRPQSVSANARPSYGRPSSTTSPR